MFTLLPSTVQLSYQNLGIHGLFSQSGQRPTNLQKKLQVKSGRRYGAMLSDF